MVDSVYELLLETASKYPDQVAIRYKKNERWVDITWTELLKQVYRVASVLIKWGIVPQDRVVILGKTRFEWVLADLGIMVAGACSVPIYQSSIAKDAVYIFENSEAKLAIVEDAEQAAKLPQVQTLKMSELLKSEEINLAEIQQRTQKLKRTDLMSIIYTSGTTGEAKGACLTHDNFLYEAHAIEKIGLLSRSDTQLLFLPLAHVFARVMEVAWIKTGHVLCFAESIEKAVENMKEVKPTLMAAVPRIYEKVHARIVSKARAEGWLKRAIANWAFACQKKPHGLAWFLAQRLVFQKISHTLKETFGGRLRFFISGGAPLNPEIAYFFKYADICILEGYGLTETAAATCVNLPEQNRIGTVGKPLPGMEVRIAEDGEICIRGRGVFQGYWKKPERTQEVFSGDGWFKTGDIGVLESGGFLKITDRKKALIVTAAGKKIAPQKLENLFKAQSSLISQVIVHGDERHYLVALLTLDEVVVQGLAKRKNLPGAYKDWTQNQFVQQKIGYVLEAVNKQLASFEQIKKVKILDHDFVVGDQLTPTLKVKRGYCEEKYAAEIAGLYGSAAKV